MLEFRKSRICEVGILRIIDTVVKLPPVVTDEVVDWKLMHWWVSYSSSEDCNKIENRVV